MDGVFPQKLFIFFFFLNKILKSNHCFFNFNLRLQMIVNCHVGAEN